MSIFALSVKPEPASQDGIRSLNGLPPDAASDGGCGQFTGQFTGQILIRMIAEVVGDPRVEKQ